MSTVAVYLDGHCTDREQGTFRGVALRVADRETTTVVHLHTGDALVELADQFTAVDHLVIAAHGGTTWILDDKYGLTTGVEKHRGQASVARFAEAWAPKFTDHPLISLAACMCSRSPSWFLKKRWGYVGSDWGARAYLPGGQASISARIRDLLVWFGCYPEVRGKRSSGHASYNPILARHTNMAGDPCVSWWGLENPGKVPTASARRAWVREKQGEASEAWLMGW